MVYFPRTLQRGRVVGCFSPALMSRKHLGGWLARRWLAGQPSRLGEILRVGTDVSIVYYNMIASSLRYCNNFEKIYHEIEAKRQTSP